MVDIAGSFQERFLGGSVRPLASGRGDTSQIHVAGGAQTHFESVLADYITRFLDHKRALGRRFVNEEKMLRLFDRFLLEQKIDSIKKVTGDVIAAFLASRPRKSARSYDHLLGTVRRLFDWLVLQDLIPSSPVKSKPWRQTAVRLPFIFDRDSASRLLQVAGNLSDNPRAPMRGLTYRTIFALLYGLGLRAGEVSRLQIQDVDLGRNLLVIRETKFAKSRLVPFGPRISALLRHYLHTREQQFSQATATTPVFSFVRDRAVNPGTISQTFHGLLPQLGLEIPPGTSTPRLHDLRHSFAVGTLVRWYRTGQDPQSRLLQLSTFLGHADPDSTAVYLTITDELLREANSRFEQFASPAIQEGSR